MKLKNLVMLFSGMAESRHPNDVIRGLGLLILLPLPDPMLASLTFPSWEQRWPPSSPQLPSHQLSKPHRNLLTSDSKNSKEDCHWSILSLSIGPRGAQP